ncbi:hypothetical protein Tco_0425153 [Tanacetum coccineum]
MRVKSRMSKRYNDIGSQCEAFKNEERTRRKVLHGIDPQMERIVTDEFVPLWIEFGFYCVGRCNGGGPCIKDTCNSRLRWMTYLAVLADAAEIVRDAIGFEYCLSSSSGWTK